MRARQEISMSIGMLLVVQAALGFGAVGLLTRMSPAIGVILRENDASLAAVEGMLSVLTTATPDEAAQARFRERLAFAEANVTEDGERELLTAVRRLQADALRGDAPARLELVKSLDALAAINRASMARAGEAARRLGAAGAWAAVLLALLGVATGLLVIRRLQRRLLLPLDELHATLGSFREGDAMRRCRFGDAPQELIEVRNVVNDLLDREDVGPCDDERHRDAAERAALLVLLDQRPTPTLVLAADGGVIAGNVAALAAMEDDPAWRAAITALRSGKTAVAPLLALPLQTGGRSNGWLLATAQDAAEGPSEGAGEGVSEAAAAG